MKLSDLKSGSSAKVVRVLGDSAATQRLMEMGVVPGVTVTVVKTAPFGDPIEVSIKDYHLAMRRSEAEAIEVSQ